MNRTLFRTTKRPMQLSSKKAAAFVMHLAAPNVLAKHWHRLTPTL